MTVPDALDASEVVLCVGSGGVGKTTVAASLGSLAAQQGRRVVVLTIDPARRLADAMGLDEVGGEPVRVPLEAPGELWVTMLDPKATFDELVLDHAADRSQAEQIIANPYYDNLSSALSGTQEFMAIERLHRLRRGGRFDLLIVDTPPSRNALDFLAAPRVLARFLSSRAVRLALPAHSRISRTISTGAQLFIRQAGRVVGRALIEDLFTFMALFAGMQAGFLERAQETEELLRADTTAFVLVTAPRREAIAESGFLLDRLADDGFQPRAVVLNRVLPDFDPDDLVDPSAVTGAGTGGGTLQTAADALAYLSECAQSEREAAASLSAHVDPSVIVEVPLLPHDIADLAGIAALTSHLD